jgi:hypothetical protein
MADIAHISCWPQARGGHLVHRATCDLVGPPGGELVSRRIPKVECLETWPTTPRRLDRRGPRSLGGLLSIRASAKWVLLFSGTALLLAACAAGPNELVDTGPDPAGFWLGLWQGLISPITFIVSLFTTNVNIYEVQNNGNWYDFGFVLGVACAFGSGGWGGTAGMRRTQRRASD